MKLVNIEVIKSELERLIRNYWFLSSLEAKIRCVVYKELSEWFDGLEVKEVDLEKEKEVKVKGFVAVDNGGDKMTWNPTGRRVAFFPKKPVRDLLTDSHYWAAHISPYDVIHLGYDAFPELKWEDEPIEVEITINKN